MFGFVGGTIAKFIKMPLISGYIIAGLIASTLINHDIRSIQGLAEMGLLLLLFSVGLELSLSKLTHTGYVAVIGAIIQMLSVGAITYLVLILLNVPWQQAIILASGFSLSSTAIVVKVLEDRAETDSIHGELMISWLITQDLAVIPIMALLPALSMPENLIAVASLSLAKSVFLVVAAFFLGRMLAPFIIHNIASTNKRELLVLGSVLLALGTGLLVSLVGISPTLGAFIAGLVISETQENHAVFSETRPLRDLFVIVFFVTLGYFVTPAVLVHDFPIILLLVVLNLVLKIIIIFILLRPFGYYGKTQFSVALGLAQIGEFSFVIFLQSNKLGILDERYASIGIATTLITLILTPFIYRLRLPLWRKFAKLSIQKNSQHTRRAQIPASINNHVIICGFGRMGKWIGVALDKARIPYIVIDYNQKIIHETKLKGIPTVYGDPAEADILKAANVETAKAIVVAIPDSVTQEEVISYCQTHHPALSIYARAHLDQDVNKISQFRVKKVIQPEFEGALSIIREIFRSMGKPKPEISERLTQLKRLHTLKI